ncbi:MAG: 16S rRNA (cytosine(1402)-N(4))-methyltransferase RsmH [Solirubrobacteraceae bacterium]
MSYHNPVLLKESTLGLVKNPDGIYIDCTFGGGGHAKEILNLLSSKGKLFAFDQDIDAKRNLIDDERFCFINQNFKFLKNELRARNIHLVDGVLADLGISSHQIDVPERGFSTRFNSELDMRMNVNSSLNAKIIVNNYSEDQLNHIFRSYSELTNHKKITKEIINFRELNPINNTEDLKSLFTNSIPAKYQNKFFAKLFQGLRIEVNDELSALKKLLLDCSEVVTENGLVVFISYHSLEDKLVKQYLKYGVFEGMPERDFYGNWKAPFKPTQSKVMIPSDEEIKLNPRARSAKMRIATRNEK